MNSETRNCNSCKQNFTIDSADFNFYKRVDVPPPTWCPDCRQQRRYSWRNERVLYRRNCDLCGKSTVTIYSSDKPYKVYCPPCWWSDKWDAYEYGVDFDFTRPFFEQFKELQLKVPRLALLTKSSVNSEYINHSSDDKNCYLGFVVFYSENILYSNWVMYSRDCMDCFYVHEKAERTYEGVDLHNCYRCQYGVLLRGCTECFYCYDCRGCTNCFLSTNLRNKQYYFLNKPYSKEGYFEKLKEYNLGSFEHRQRLYQQFLDLVEKEAIHRYVTNEQTVNAVGGTMFSSKNVYQCFDIDKVEDSRYCYATLETKDSMDGYHFGFKMELVYESHALVRGYFNLFSHLSYDDSYIWYCDSCHNSQNLFGCVGIKKGEYSILNKRYSPEEFTVLKEKIIEHMKSTGEYGEFFPVALSPFGYNETQGQVYMPLTKEEVSARGWKWEDHLPGTFGKETVRFIDIPDVISEIPDTIINEILVCMQCRRNYNIVKPELDFYRNENIPLPRLCYDCRYKRRIPLRAPRKVWQRQCMCDYIVHKNLGEHTHHPKGRCPNSFYGSYAPERKEVIYCEECYNAEVV